VKLVHLVGFVTKKFVMMHGHMYAYFTVLRGKCAVVLYFLMSVCIIVYASVLGAGSAT
jgi:hypothetical protein